MTIRNHRLRATTILLAALALVAGLASFSGLAGPAAAAPSAPVTPDRPNAPTNHCEADQSGTHVGTECEHEGEDDDSSDDDANDNRPGIDPAEACADYGGWGDCEGFVQMNGIHPDDMCGYMIDPNQELLDYYEPDAPEGALLRTWICPREGVVYTEDTDWIPGAEPPPDPEDVAEGLWVAVQAELAAPTLETWPPQNMSSVLRLPSFVAVTNWPDVGVLEREDCDGGTCVALQATPSLTYDPGDGTGDIACEPGGTTFDRYGAEPEEQAEGEACAHAFTRRTGIRGRPEAWPGEVSITWNAAWQEILGDGSTGETGTFDPVVLATDLPRVVTELFSVVTGVTPSGRG